jgi:Fur family transcriptional regulator, ferric uptake regulator
VPDTSTTVDDLLAELRKAGHRATTARRAVLEELVAAGPQHRTADDIARRISDRYPTIHLSTVYRTLDALAGAGIIALARFGDEPATYHLATDRHHHAVCTRCGTTIDVATGALDPLRRRLQRDYDFHADPHHLTIEGLCGDCAAG